MTIDSSDKRNAIILATIKLIAKYGFHGTPIALIAKEAGVGAGTIYRYFPDKDALVHEIFWQIDAELKECLLREYDASRPIRERFIHLLSGVFQYGLRHPYEFKFIEQFYNSPYGTNLRREKLFCQCAETCQSLPLEQVFDFGRRQQVIKDLPSAALLALAMGPIIFLINDNIAGLIQVDEATVGATIAACWDAIKR